MEKSKLLLKEMQEAIKNSASAVEAEFNRTPNDWLSCFGSRVFVVEAYLSNKQIRELFTPQEYKQVWRKLEQLKQRLQELKKQYPERINVPSNEIKHELFKALNILD